MLEGLVMEGPVSYVYGGRLTSTVHSQFHTMESLDDRFRCLMDRSFQFVKKCGDFAAALPNQASEDSDSVDTFCDDELEIHPQEEEVIVKLEQHQTRFRHLMERTSHFYRRCLSVLQRHI